MKKKIIIASATVLFAIATMFNMNLLQGNSVGDVSLESIEVMTKAQGEDSPMQCRFIDFMNNCYCSWSYHSYCTSWACNPPCR